MVQGTVSVVVTSLMVWVSIPYFGTLDPLGMRIQQKHVRKYTFFFNIISSKAQDLGFGYYCV